MSACDVIFTIFKDLTVFWKVLVFVLTPILLLPLPLLLPSSEAQCGYVILLMAVYWVTETLPLSVTALIPIILFPILGIMPAKKVAGLYIADSTLVLMSGMMLALAIEKCNLHKRIGLGILVILGSQPSRMLIGCMLPTWFLSMWISNTATTSMMIPVVEAVLCQLKEGIREKKARNDARRNAIAQLEKANQKQKEAAACSNVAYIDDNNTEMTYFGETDGESASRTETANGNGAIHRSVPEVTVRDDTSIIPPTDEDLERRGNAEDGSENDEYAVEEARLKKYSKMLCLSICYSANVGGTTTLTGTPTNFLVSEAAASVYASHGLDPPLTFTTWLFFGLPHSVICFVILWAWLQLVFMGWRPFCCCVKDKTPQNTDGVKKVLKEQYDQLGPIGFGEVSALVFLILMVVLWFARDPGFAPGYASLFKEGYVTDSFPGILIAVLLFMWPSLRPNWLCFRPDGEKAKRVPALLDWNTVSTKLPWGPVILLGGGFVIAKGCEESGLSGLIGEQMASLKNIPVWALAMIVTITVAFLTEITSNTAIISLMLPILRAMAEDIGINPLYLMLPAGMAASYAFMLPIATPPNAIVFSYGHLRIIDMAMVGFAMNIFCILVVTIGINTWGMAIFRLNEVPWATSGVSNATAFTTMLTTA